MSDKEIVLRLKNLINNEDFYKVFIEEFVENRTKHLVLNEDVDSEEVRNKLKAIKEFKDFIDYYVTLEV